MYCSSLSPPLQAERDAATKTEADDADQPEAGGDKGMMKKKKATAAVAAAAAEAKKKKKKKTKMTRQVEDRAEKS